MASDLSVAIAFTAGLISFLSPCVLPIIPGFLAYLSGASLGEAGLASRIKIFANSFFFVLGFSAVFASLGVLLNTLLEAVAYDVQLWLSRIGGAIVILFGLLLTGLIRIKFLERPHTFKVKSKFSSSYFTSFVFGSAFAAGWTPCVGAALGAVLGLAATEPTSAFVFLLAYSIGLGMPFLVVGAFVSQANKLIDRYARILKYVNMVFGVILIALGILVFTQSLNLIANLELLNKFLLR